jgi:hypothetical protein
MSIIVKKHRVRVGGETFLPGKVITGLSEEEEKSLVDGGYCEYPFVIDSQADSITEQTETGSPLHISIEQFTELKAAGQKETLEKLGVVAGSNEKERIQQYTDFLEGNDPFKKLDDDSEENGPNTSITS